MHANPEPSSANRTRYYVESTNAQPLPITNLGHFTAHIYCLHTIINRRPHAAVTRNRAKTKRSPHMRLIPPMQEKIATIRKIAYSHAADVE